MVPNLSRRKKQTLPWYQTLANTKQTFPWYQTLANTKQTIPWYQTLAILHTMQTNQWY